MFLNHIPVPIRVGVGGYRLEHQCGGSQCQGAVHDIGVSGNPPTIRGAAVHVSGLYVEGVLGGQHGVQHVSTGGVLQSLGLACRVMYIVDWSYI